MRLFVAVDVDRDTAARAGHLINVLRRRAAELAPDSKITWVAADRLHLTVRFIGAAADDLAATIRRELEPPLALAPFGMTIAGTGAFPKIGPPRVVWAGVSDGAGALREVERQVTERLTRAGVPPEARAYNPHLTLARIRDASGLRPAALFEGLADFSAGTSHIEAITLFESRLSPRGAEYVALQRTPLRAG
jgi:RNA 2',3'-cyclic 3'-phosphodiesterase